MSDYEDEEDKSGVKHHAVIVMHSQGQQEQSPIGFSSLYSRCEWPWECESEACHRVEDEPDDPIIPIVGDDWLRSYRICGKTGTPLDKFTLCEVSLTDWKERHCPNLKQIPKAVRNHIRYLTKSAANSEQTMPNLSCHSDQFHQHFEYFMRCFTSFKHGRTAEDRADASAKDGWLTRLCKLGQDSRAELQDRIKHFEEQAAEKKEANRLLQDQITNLGLASDGSFNLPTASYLGYLEAQRAEFRALNRLWCLRKTQWQYVFFLAAHAVEDDVSILRAEHNEIWWHVGRVVPATVLRNEFLQQQRSVQELFRFQPFRKFLISLFVLNGWLYFVWQDRSTVEISKPLNINVEEDEDFILSYFWSLIVLELPCLAGHEIGTEIIDSVVHHWSFAPTRNSQWEIQVDKPELNQKRIFRTVDPYNLPPFIYGVESLGRCPFHWEIAEYGGQRAVPLFLKFDWQPMNHATRSLLLPGITLASEIDHLRLHMELNLYGKLQLHESGKLYQTEDHRSRRSGTWLQYYDVYERQRVVAYHLWFGRHKFPGETPRSASEEGNRRLQRRACAIISDFAKPFERKLREEPGIAHQAFPYWAFGALAFELLVYRTTGFIQGDFNFGNMRYNGQDRIGSDYTKMKDYETTIGDWNLAEIVPPNTRVHESSTATRAFMAVDLYHIRHIFKDTFRKLLYHDLEAFFWAFNITVGTSLEHVLRRRCGLPTERMQVFTTGPETVQTESVDEQTTIMTASELSDCRYGQTPFKSAIAIYEEKALKKLRNRQSYLNSIKKHGYPEEWQKCTLQSRDVQAYRRETAGPFKSKLAEYGLATGYEHIHELMSKWHQVLNCDLEKECASRTSETIDYFRDEDELYEMKRKDAETGGKMAEAVLMRMLEILGEGFEHGGLFMKNVKERIEKAEAARPAALRAFQRKYPESCTANSTDSVVP